MRGYLLELPLLFTDCCHHDFYSTRNFFPLAVFPTLETHFSRLQVLGKANWMHFARPSALDCAPISCGNRDARLLFLKPKINQTLNPNLAAGCALPLVLQASQLSNRLSHKGGAIGTARVAEATMPGWPTIRPEVESPPAARRASSASGPRRFAGGLFLPPPGA